MEHPRTSSELPPMDFNRISRKLSRIKALAVSAVEAAAEIIIAIPPIVIPNLQKKRLEFESELDSL